MYTANTRRKLPSIKLCKEKLELEMNAANDNPLIFDNDDETLVISGGNFHGQPIAFAVDF